MSIKFLLLGGGGGMLGFGGGSADFIFMGARIFLKDHCRQLTIKRQHINFFNINL